ncbi:Heterokaryon incompatibility domain-containing protein [Madurella fahalii]|uniref:Heterokaryon incompatibility domain-containing protein n=1 Tax=Madurella fahalii TaxID=1157608 RepID=A0ABQ0GGK9_9PEZI
MSRWHKPVCTAPDIMVDQVQVSCRSCGSAPNLDEINPLAYESPFPEPPPDKPRGKMDLWWPPSVPYRDIVGRLSEDAAGVGNASEEMDETVSKAPISSVRETGPTETHHAAQSTIYTTKVGKGQFRLACITATPNVDHPIHLELETYSLNNCPEYETVSYCWAGEDGDSTRQHPVYVGPYWDVMLHTRNCWELLRFVRPRRGIRMLWVDALCINQVCVEERNAQVAQMRRVYTECMQVVAYLGPDIAQVLPQGQYPRRHRLQEFGTTAASVTTTAAAKEVTALLARRYFSRLWVIQELILSPRVVMRVGDIDFWADGTATGRVWPSETRDAGVPWVAHLSNGAPLELSLCEVMHLASATTCADPRDHLFGALGLVSARPRHFEPDYSLPSQYVFIGLFAHLLVSRGLHLLAHASGISGPPSVPSWVPDWTRWETWQPLFKCPKPEQPGELHPIFQDPSIRLIEENGDTLLVPVVLPSESHYPAPARRYEALAVDRKTGGLLAQGVRLLVLRSTPKMIGELKERSQFLFEAQAGRHSVLLCSQHRLDVLVEPGIDCLYLFGYASLIAQAGFYLLREDVTLGSRSFRLVAYCDMVLFNFSYSLLSAKQWPWIPGFDTRINKGHPLQPYRVYRGPEHTSAVPGRSSCRILVRSNPVVGELYWTVYEVIENTRAWLNAMLEPPEQLLFFAKARHQDLLSIYQAALDEELIPERPMFKPSDRFRVPYAKQLRDMDVIAIRWNDVGAIFTVRYDAVDARYREHRFGGVWSETDHGCRVIGFRERNWGEQWSPETESESWFSCLSRKFSPFPKTRPDQVILMMPYYTMARIFHRSRGLKLVYLIREAARRTGETEAQLMSRSLTDADRLIRIPTGRFAETLINYCGCEGTTEEVLIL